MSPKTRRTDAGGSNEFWPQFNRRLLDVERGETHLSPPIAIPPAGLVIAKQKKRKRGVVPPPTHAMQEFLAPLVNYAFAGEECFRI